MEKSELFQRLRLEYKKGKEKKISEIADKFLEEIIQANSEGVRDVAFDYDDKYNDAETEEVLQELQKKGFRYTRTVFHYFKKDELKAKVVYNVSWNE